MSDWFAKGIYAAHISRLVYGDFRRWLLPTDPRRTDPKYGDPEHRVVEDKTHAWYLQQYDVLRNILLLLAQDPTNGKKALVAFTSETGIHEICVLWRLPNFDIVDDIMSDAMHIISGIIGRHLFPMLKGQRIPNKSRKQKNQEQKQEQKIADDLAELQSQLLARQANGIQDLDIDTKVDDVRYQPEAPINIDEEQEQSVSASLKARREDVIRKHKQYCLTKAEQRGIDDLYKSLKLPHSWYMSPSHLPMQRTGTLKCREWQTIVEHLLPTLLRCMCDDPERRELYRFLCKFCRVISSLIAKEQVFTGPKDSRYWRVVRVLCDFERLVPETEHCQMLMQLLKLAKDVRCWGNAQQFIMYPIERDMGKVARIVKSKKHPETNIIRYFQFYHGSQRLAQAAMQSTMQGSSYVKRLTATVESMDHWTRQDLKVVLEPLHGLLMNRCFDDLRMDAMAGAHELIRSLNDIDDDINSQDASIGDNSFVTFERYRSFAAAPEYVQQKWVVFPPLKSRQGAVINGKKYSVRSIYDSELPWDNGSFVAAFGSYEFGTQTGDVLLSAFNTHLKLKRGNEHKYQTSFLSSQKR